MTREIKFRAWDKKQKKTREICMLETNNKVLENEFQAQYYFEGEYTYSRDIELMQYTGLLDKNGKEIYEGDILKMDGGTPRVVFFGDGMFQLEGWVRISTWKDEIIGNIYENPELLK